MKRKRLTILQTLAELTGQPLVCGECNHHGPIFLSDQDTILRCRPCKDKLTKRSKPQEKRPRTKLTKRSNPQGKRPRTKMQLIFQQQIVALQETLLTFIDALKTQRGQCKECATLVTSDTVSTFVFEIPSPGYELRTINQMIQARLSPEQIEHDIAKSELFCHLCHIKRALPNNTS